MTIPLSYGYCHHPRSKRSAAAADHTFETSATDRTVLRGSRTTTMGTGMCPAATAEGTGVTMIQAGAKTVAAFFNAITAAGRTRHTTTIAIGAVTTAATIGTDGLGWL